MHSLTLRAVLAFCIALPMCWCNIPRAEAATEVKKAPPACPMCAQEEAERKSNGPSSSRSHEDCPCCKISMKREAPVEPTAIAAPMANVSLLLVTDIHRFKAAAFETFQRRLITPGALHRRRSLFLRDCALLM